HPFFSVPSPFQVFGPFQLSEALTNGLGITAQNLRHILDPTMAEFGCLNRCIATASLLTQGTKKPLHHPFHVRRIGVHANLPIDLPTTDTIITKRQKIGKLIAARSLVTPTDIRSRTAASWTRRE